MILAPRRRRWVFSAFLDSFHFLIEVGTVGEVLEFSEDFVCFLGFELGFVSAHLTFVVEDGVVGKLQEVV